MNLLTFQSNVPFQEQKPLPFRGRVPKPFDTASPVRINSASGRRERGAYSFAEQGDHAHELVTALYRASIWSLAALFSERVGMNART